jgi:hypothetical protein
MVSNGTNNTLDKMFFNVCSVNAIGTVVHEITGGSFIRQLAVGELQTVLQEHRFRLAGRKANNKLYGAIFVKSTSRAESVSMAKGSQ